MDTKSYYLWTDEDLLFKIYRRKITAYDWIILLDNYRQRTMHLDKIAVR
jgi:hypothetical protein